VQQADVTRCCGYTGWLQAAADCTCERIDECALFDDPARSV